MSTPILDVRGLSKCYRLGSISRHTLVEEVEHFLLKLRRKSPAEHMGKLDQKPLKEPKDFWALKDVSFQIHQGEVLGIVGGNGAGKSTLLKILSQITEPTRGEATIRGRVGSLLEVGTGFHPELTGRDNVFMNGTLLGMRRQEVASKFDEIVAFSGVEKFIDTPVKRYSSGMYVRLAFAVAAHLEPEILIVDEVLAVGDADFQKKCLGKMGDVAKQGRTVLFVSHNMAAVENLCSRSIWLKDGQKQMDGPSKEVILSYLEEQIQSGSEQQLATRTDRVGSGRAKIVDFYVENEAGNPQSFLQPGNPYTFCMVCEGDTEMDAIIASIGLQNTRGESVLLLRSNFTLNALRVRRGRTVIKCHIDDFNLVAGKYNLALLISLADRETLDFLASAGQIQVAEGDYFGTGSNGMPSHCSLLTKGDWESC